MVVLARGNVQFLITALRLLALAAAAVLVAAEVLVLGVGRDHAAARL